MTRKRKNNAPMEPEDRPLTKEMLKEMRPASEVVPEIVEAHARGELGYGADREGREFTPPLRVWLPEGKARR